MTSARLVRPCLPAILSATLLTVSPCRAAEAFDAARALTNAVVENGIAWIDGRHLPIAGCAFRPTPWRPPAASGT